MDARLFSAMMLRSLLVLALVGLIAASCGCASTGGQPIPVPEIVKVPVAVARTPPPELLAPIDATALPVFVAPTDPKATSGLTAEGERDLKLLLLDLKTRLQAWAKWATTPDAAGP